MSVTHIGLILDKLDVKPSTKLVAIILADHADRDGICWPSYRRIAERAGMDERTVRRHIATLRDLEVITKLRNGTVVRNGSRTYRVSNAYRINTHILTGFRSLLSTDRLGIADTVDHLEVDNGGHLWGGQLSTKPSKKRQSNRQFVEHVDNSDGHRDPVALSDVIGLLIQPVEKDS